VHDLCLGETSHVPVAIRISVVPVSTIPAVVERMVVVPYLMDWSIPQYSLAGDVVVAGLSSFAT
jgi:hypothetical protein